MSSASEIVLQQRLVAKQRRLLREAEAELRRLVRRRAAPTEKRKEA